MRVRHIFICGLPVSTVFVHHTSQTKDRGRVAEWLRCCATNRKDSGTIPGGVIGILH